MRDFIQPVLTIAGKDIKDALKDRFILLMTAFLLIAVSYTHLTLPTSDLV